MLHTGKKKKIKEKTTLGKHTNAKQIKVATTFMYILVRCNEVLPVMKFKLVKISKTTQHNKHNKNKSNKSIRTELFKQSSISAVQKCYIQKQKSSIRKKHKFKTNIKSLANNPFHSYEAQTYKSCSLPNITKIRTYQTNTQKSVMNKKGSFYFTILYEKGFLNFIFCMYF